MDHGRAVRFEAAQRSSPSGNVQAKNIHEARIGGHASKGVCGACPAAREAEMVTLLARRLPRRPNHRHHPHPLSLIRDRDQLLPVSALLGVAPRGITASRSGGASRGDTGGSEPHGRTSAEDMVGSGRTGRIRRARSEAWARHHSSRSSAAVCPCRRPRPVERINNSRGPMKPSPTMTATWPLGTRLAAAPNALLRPRPETDMFACFVRCGRSSRDPCESVRSEGGEMRALKTFLVAVTFLLFSGPLSAQANIIYDWTGECRQVAPQGLPCTHATLHVVTTDDYIPGEIFFPHLVCTATACTPVSMPVLLEFLYIDDNSRFDYTFVWLNDDGNFYLPPLLPGESGPGEGGLLTTAQDFFSHYDGSWRAGGEDRAPGCDAANPPGNNPFCGYRASGVGGTWTRVPDPPTLVLLGVGLTGLTFLRRRRVGSPTFPTEGRR